MIIDKIDHEVEAILGHCFNKHDKESQLEYFIKWKGLPDEDISWKWKNNLWKLEEMI